MAISNRQPPCFLLFLTRKKLTFKKYDNAYEGKRAFAAFSKVGRKPLVTKPSVHYGFHNGSKIRYLTTGEEYQGVWYQHAVYVEGAKMGIPLLAGNKFAYHPEGVNELIKAARRES